MKRLASWLIVLATTGALAGACTSHGAGGRCDPLNVPAGTNQNADCDNGLVCISGAELQLPDGGGSPQGNFCCPTDRTQNLDPSNICYASSNVIGDDASIPDTGATDTSTSDAPSDSSTSDSATDAPSDSASDAGDASDASGE